MKVLVVTLGTRVQIASSRLRVFDALKYMQDHQIISDFEFTTLVKPVETNFAVKRIPAFIFKTFFYYLKLFFLLSKKWDLIECNQCFLPRWLSSCLATKYPLILDFTDLGSLDDDYAWQSYQRYGRFAKILFFFRNREKKAMLKMCQYAKIIFSNSALTLPDFLQPFSDKFEVLYDPINCDVFKPAAKQNKIVVGWTGSQGTAYLVNSIKDVLTKIKTKYDQQIEIRLFGSDDDSPFDAQIKAIATIVPWDLDKAPQETAKIDIGLAPAFEDQLTRYKQPVKINQYMSVGAVPIATPVGMVPFMISNGSDGFLAKNDQQWFEYISELIENSTKLEELAAAARQKALEQYSYPAYTTRWLELLEKAKR